MVNFLGSDSHRAANKKMYHRVGRGQLVCAALAVSVKKWIFAYHCHNWKSILFEHSEFMLFQLYQRQKSILAHKRSEADQLPPPHVVP